MFKVLQQSLPDDLISETIRYIDFDVLFCFNSESDAYTTLDSKVMSWSKVWNHLVCLGKQDKKEYNHLLQLLKKWKLQQSSLSLLKTVLCFAIQYNHLLTIHLLLNEYPEIGKNQEVANHLFFHAVKWNRPHLLRLFVALWDFNVAKITIQQSLNWIGQHETPHIFNPCERECKLLYGVV